uniref:Uncharacterized protein n=1 Tax=Nelumbo nucifera TaxID=4432 RepID=A0A822XML0_NELNU|nr:TPA_asm: hypothetical protein HUJ06_022395 [Nelumbo nucifera]DAD20933.1 TPA_asm: hypothetical protein HUJ06_022396 [Nelumbo nucifera]
MKESEKGFRVAYLYSGRLTETTTADSSSAIPSCSQRSFFNSESNRVVLREREREEIEE